PAHSSQTRPADDRRRRETLVGSAERSAALRPLAPDGHQDRSRHRRQGGRLPRPPRSRDRRAADGRQHRERLDASLGPDLAALIAYSCRHTPCAVFKPPPPRERVAQTGRVRAAIERRCNVAITTDRGYRNRGRRAFLGILSRLKESDMPTRAYR